MPVTKIGQTSHTAVNELQQKHFDVDMKIREVLNILELKVKMKLASRLPQIVDEIKADMETIDGSITG